MTRTVLLGIGKAAWLMLERMTSHTNETVATTAILSSGGVMVKLIKWT